MGYQPRLVGIVIALVISSQSGTEGATERREFIDRSIEPSLENADLPEGLTAVELDGLSDDSPLLRLAYYKFGAQFMGRNHEVFIGGGQPEIRAVLEHLEARGDEATPLLLDIMLKNQNASIESRLPLMLMRIESISKTPFADYAREQLSTRRPEEFTASAVETFASLLKRYGRASDLDMIVKFAQDNEYFAWGIRRILPEPYKSQIKLGEELTDTALYGTVTDGSVTDGKSVNPLPNRKIDTPGSTKTLPPESKEIIETPNLPGGGGGGTGFVIGLAAGALALIAVVWFWLRRKSA